MSHHRIIPLLLACAAPVGAVPEGLIFHASFDRLLATADVAGGEPTSTFTASLELRGAEGVRGAGLLQQPGERCSYPIAGNLDTSQGSFSIWVKPLNWDGHSGKFRHFLVATPADGHVMLLYLYPIGDEAVFNYIRVGAGTPENATWRAGAPVDFLKRGEWTHLVSTWDAAQVRLYANGRRVGDGLVARPLPKVETGTFTICPIDYWRHPNWGDPDEQTICDEVRVFDRALSDEEVLDLYAEEVPGGVDLEPALSVALAPRYAARRIVVTVRPAHLDAAWRQRLAAGAELRLTVSDPAGAQILSHRGAVGDGEFEAELGDWLDGEYVARAELTAADATLAATATLTKPPTPWLPARTDWRADRVLEPWTPLRREGDDVVYWNGRIRLDGPFPAVLTSSGESVLAAPIRLLAGGPPEWGTGQVVEALPERIVVAGDGRLSSFAASYRTTVEFDGLVRADLVLTPPPGGADLASLAVEIPVPPEVARYYRNPTCQEWDGVARDERAFLPYAWLGNEQRGLSWFAESEANQVRGPDDPAVTLRREGNAVVVKLNWITATVRVERPLAYTLGLEATPVRPVPADLYRRYFASGPQFRGPNQFVYGWGTQISGLNARLLADDPEGERRRQTEWLARDKHSLSYTCLQCTASASPEYRFFATEWSQPYGATFSGYKRPPNDEPYSLVPVCTHSSFAEFLVWCVEQHLANGWGDGIYTDIDGIVACDNALHGCGYTDAFGRSGRTWPIYAHRALSRRIYEACHRHGKPYYSHAHSHWYAPFNAFCDGWCPGEQYSSAVLDSPAFYMTGIPDRVWRSEFYTPTTGVPTFLLPQLGRLAGAAVLADRGPSETCIVAAMTYGVPLWAGAIAQQVVEEVWAVQQEFGIGDAEFVPFWRQTEITADAPEVRVSCWSRTGRRLAVVANFGDAERAVQVVAAGERAELRVAWPPSAVSAASPSPLPVRLPPHRGVLVEVSGLEGKPTRDAG